MMEMKTHPFNMKTLFRLWVLILALGFGAVSAFANQAESARVIRKDLDNHDLLVERLNGELWLLQHNPLCSSMSSEFPVHLIIESKIVKQLKVGVSEICKVYNAFPYGGEATMTARVPSDNELNPEHEAEIDWGGIKYRVGYGSGCSDIREFVGQKLYVSLLGKGLKGGKLVLPNNRGQCVIKTVQEIGMSEEVAMQIPPKLEGLEFQAQNNQVYFYWTPASEEKPLYLISYSRYQLNPSLYPWKLMPNLKIVKGNSFTVKNLANRKKYYFYLATLSKDNVAGEWTEITATPVSSGGLKNDPDPEPFEAKVQETNDAFVLTWPAKEVARRYRITLYVNGKPEFMKLMKEDTLEYRVSKLSKYLGKGLRFTVKTLPKEPTNPTYFDGVYWEYKAK